MLEITLSAHVHEFDWYRDNPEYGEFISRCWCGVREPGTYDEGDDDERTKPIDHRR